MAHPECRSPTEWTNQRSVECAEVDQSIRSQIEVRYQWCYCIQVRCDRKFKILRKKKLVFIKLNIEMVITFKRIK